MPVALLQFQGTPISFKIKPTHLRRYTEACRRGPWFFPSPSGHWLIFSPCSGLKGGSLKGVPTWNVWVCVTLFGKKWSLRRWLSILRWEHLDYLSGSQFNDKYPYKKKEDTGRKGEIPRGGWFENGGRDWSDVSINLQEKDRKGSLSESLEGTNRLTPWFQIDDLWNGEKINFFLLSN